MATCLLFLSLLLALHERRRGRLEPLQAIFKEEAPGVVCPAPQRLEHVVFAAPTAGRERCVAHVGEHTLFGKAVGLPAVVFVKVETLDATKSMRKEARYKRKQLHLKIQKFFLRREKGKTIPKPKGQSSEKVQVSGS